MFTNTDIKGGVAITLRNPEKDFGEIGVFTAFDELNSLLSKVIGGSEHESFAEIVVTRTAYRLTDKMHKDYPLAIDSLSDGHPYDMSTNIFELLPNIFFDSKPSSSGDYIQILGRENNRRAFKYIRAEYVNEPKNLDCWKVILPQIG